MLVSNNEQETRSRLPPRFQVMQVRAALSLFYSMEAASIDEDIEGTCICTWCGDIDDRERRSRLFPICLSSAPYRLSGEIDSHRLETLFRKKGSVMASATANVESMIAAREPAICHGFANGCIFRLELETGAILAVTPACVPALSMLRAPRSRVQPSLNHSCLVTDQPHRSPGTSGHFHRDVSESGSVPRMGQRIIQDSVPVERFAQSYMQQMPGQAASVAHRTGRLAA